MADIIDFLAALDLTRPDEFTVHDLASQIAQGAEEGAIDGMLVAIRRPDGTWRVAWDEELDLPDVSLGLLRLQREVMMAIDD